MPVRAVEESPKTPTPSTTSVRANGAKSASSTTIGRCTTSPNCCTTDRPITPNATTVEPINANQTKPTTANHNNNNKQLVEQIFCLSIFFFLSFHSYIISSHPFAGCHLNALKWRHVAVKWLITSAIKDYYRICIQHPAIKSETLYHVWDLIYNSIQFVKDIHWN